MNNNMRNIVFKQMKEINIVPEDKNITWSSKRKSQYISKVEDFFISNESGIDLEKRIILLGDSVAQCLLMEAKHRISSRIEKLLVNEKIYYSVLNAAVGGNTSLHSLLKLLAVMKQARPSVVILMGFVFDSECCSRKESFWNSYWSHTPIEPPMSISSDIYAEDMSEGIAERERILLIFKEVCNIYNIKFITVTNPMKYVIKLKEEYKKISIENLDKYDLIKIINDSHKEFCIKNNIPVIDVDFKIKNNREKMFYDDVHLNEYGTKVVSLLIYEELKDILVEDKDE